MFRELYTYLRLQHVYRIPLGNPPEGQQGGRSKVPKNYIYIRISDIVCDLNDFADLVR